jgi:hypothetical protein
MSGPEQREKEGKHPVWVRQIYPSRTTFGKLGREAQRGKRALEEQIMATDRLRASLSVQGAGRDGASNFIDYFLQPDIREVTFHEKITEFLHERQGLTGARVLIVNLGDAFHDLSVPAEMAEHNIETAEPVELRDNPMEIDFLGKFYDGDLSDFTEFFGGSCIFSEIEEEEELMHKATDNEGYDFMIIFGDDNEKNEGGIRRKTPAKSKLLAQRLTKTLKRGGSIFVSGYEGVDVLGSDLLEEVSSKEDFGSEEYKDPMFVDMYSGIVYALTPFHKMHT